MVSPQNQLIGIIKKTGDRISVHTIFEKQAMIETAI